MNRIRMLSHIEASFPAVFPEAMLSANSPGMLTDTAPLPAPLTATSRSTLADVTPEIAHAFSTQVSCLLRATSTVSPPNPLLHIDCQFAKARQRYLELSAAAVRCHVIRFVSV